MGYEPNTINAKVYTPGGVQVFICLSLDDMVASDIDAFILERGFLVAPKGLEAGEETEYMTMVMRRTQHNKDNSTTPCIGLYHENDKLQWCYWNLYLNNDDDIAQFESASGVKVNSIPEYMGDGFPQRTSPNAQRFMVTLPQPLAVAVTKEDYIKDDGTAGRKTATLRIVGGTTPNNVTTFTGFTRETADTFTRKWRDKGLTDDQILDGLGVSRLSEWKQSIEAADAALVKVSA